MGSGAIRMFASSGDSNATYGPVCLGGGNECFQDDAERQRTISTKLDLVNRGSNLMAEAIEDSPLQNRRKSVR